MVLLWNVHASLQSKFQFLPINVQSVYLVLCLLLYFACPIMKLSWEGLHYTLRTITEYQTLTHHMYVLLYIVAKGDCN